MRLRSFVLSLVVALAATTAGAATLTRQVFGYYPYWSQAPDPTTLRWDLLSYVAWFSAGLDSTGTVTTWHGWNTSSSAALIAEAHKHGVAVVLAVTNFSSSGIHGIVTTGHDAAIKNLVDGIVAAGGDGVNLDFEGMASADRDNLTKFVADLAAALRARIPGAHVSLALPSVDWSKAYDYAGLATSADALVMMAYDYHWTGSSTAGPNSPLTSGMTWSSYDVTWSVNDYLTKVGTAQRAKVFVAVPLYGYDYPTAADTVPSSTRASGSAVLYKTTEVNAQTYGRKWDLASQTPYYVYDKSGDGWHQVWYDDAMSLGLKFDLVNAKDLGGIGIWAMGYEGTSGTFWDAVQSHFTAPSVDGGIDAGATGMDAGGKDAGGMDAGGHGADGLKGGCDCRVGDHGGSSTGAMIAGGVLLLGLAWRRRG